MTLPATNRPASLSLVPAADCPAVAYSTVLLGRIPAVKAPSDLEVLETTDPLCASYCRAMGVRANGPAALANALIAETLLTAALAGR